VDARTAPVLRAVKCPSLARQHADRLQVAESRRRPGACTCSISPRCATPLSETRNVDDQAEWLDDESIATGCRASRLPRGWRHLDARGQRPERAARSRARFLAVIH
jgi:hypothetical protein